MKKDDKEIDLADVIGGTLNIFGLKIDLAQLLSTPEEARGQLDELRERLKKLGGKEALSDEDWKSGAAAIGGKVRTQGILGNREYHIGAVPGPAPQTAPGRARQAPEVIEPPVDIFDEPQETIIVAEIPGVALEDLDLKVEGRQLHFTTRPSARQAYRKTIELSADVEPDSLKASCRNGVLEIQLRKKSKK